jgi:hypothetical protein
VDYNDLESLKYALRGIDTVISTVTGRSQIELIKAAVSIRVRRFAPAEFEGLPQLRAPNDPLDRGRTVARQYLQHYAQFIQSTTFVCGIFYERFQPGGLQHTRIGLTSSMSGEGDYIMNCRTMSAKVPAYDADENMTVTICMTAAQDVARFVTKALDLPSWPAELRMMGQRVLVKDLVETVQRLKGTQTRLWCNILRCLLIISVRTTLQPYHAGHSRVAPTRAGACKCTAKPRSGHSTSRSACYGRRSLRLLSAQHEPRFPGRSTDAVSRLVHREVESPTVKWLQHSE